MAGKHQGQYLNSGQPFFILKILFIYSWETERERGRDIGRGRSRLHAGSPMLDSVPRPQDHTLSQSQMLNPWATQAPTLLLIKTVTFPRFKSWDHVLQLLMRRLSKNLLLCFKNNHTLQNETLGKCALIKMINIPFVWTSSLPPGISWNTLQISFLLK